MSQKIVVRSADILDIQIESDGALEIAKRSRGTPRIANRLLRRVRDFADVKTNENFCLFHLSNKLEADASGFFKPKCS
jgi:Holliday junction DNA helicase RuvB